MTTAYIYDSLRTPRGKGKKDGSLYEITPVSLAAQVLESVRDRNGLAADTVDDVVFGCCSTVGEQAAVITRMAILSAGYGDVTSGLQLNRFCGSGLEAVNVAASKVITGEADVTIGGGVESMSRVPMGSDGGGGSVDPAVAMDMYFVPQGISADLLATKYGYTRNDVDAYATESQKRAATAWADGRFDKSVVPVRDVMGEVVLSKDEMVRADTSVTALSELKPSFTQMGRQAGFDGVAIQKYPEIEAIEHVHHAGNSSAIVDGAAAVLIGNKAFGAQMGLKPRAKIRAMASIGSEPTMMLTGPEFVTNRVLERCGMTKDDIDLWELNEAFSSVVLRFIEAIDIDHASINVNGGAIAMGHPLGATGAMIVGTAIDELERSGKGTALVTICVGAGMGVATVIERI
ncbi:MAG: acetyl-CoA C-acetyltransferase [Pseudomonadota bacterium]